MLNILTDKINDKGSSANILKIGVVNNFSGNDEIKDSFSKFLDKVKSMGHETIAIDIPFDKAQFDLKNLVKDRETVNELFVKADLFLLPTLNDYVPTIKEAQEKGPQAIAPANTFFCNYFGLPAISIPYGKDTKGFPLSFQVVGKPMQDHQMLEFAKPFN